MKHLFRKARISFVLAATTLLFTHPALAATTTAYPTSDNTIQWTAAGSWDHYQNINETNCNEDTDYNYTETQGNIDQYDYTFPAEIIGETLTHIKAVPCFAGFTTYGGTSSTIKIFYYLNTVFIGMNTTSWVTDTTTWVTNQNLLGVDIDNEQITANSTLRLQVQYVGDKGIKLSSMPVILTY